MILPTVYGDIYAMFQGMLQIWAPICGIHYGDHTIQTFTQSTELL